MNIHARIDEGQVTSCMVIDRRWIESVSRMLYTNPKTSMRYDHKYYNEGRHMLENSNIILRIRF